MFRRVEDGAEAYMQKLHKGAERQCAKATVAAATRTMGSNVRNG